MKSVEIAWEYISIDWLKKKKNKKKKLMMMMMMSLESVCVSDFTEFFFCRGFDGKMYKWSAVCEYESGNKIFVGFKFLSPFFFLRKFLALMMHFSRPEFAFEAL